ncbi:MAG TPA: flagellin [Candidatus Paceibacterota bacterium]|nr:flagellin [Verrucomicrobiota bacterium]HRY48836.1 flagellin [Candidatus Paceibacterota bacterium]HSA01585.1 flagellin [Candidatus Paceibacterota bacterium]
MVINTNISAQNSARLLTESNSMLSKSLSRLSSGSKIVSPEDDAAGLAVSMRFDAQVNRIAAANSNVGNAISYAQTQDGFMKKVSKALDRMSELATLAQDSTKTTTDLSLYDKEFQTLNNYIKDLAGKDFNGVSLFGSGSNLQVTTDSDANKFTMATAGAGTSANTNWAAGTNGSITSASNASTALGYVKNMINDLATDRANTGSNIARLSYTSEQLGVLKTNVAAANSRIKDVDVAEESTQFARYNILVQAGTAMLAQANATPQSALRLLS